MVKNNTKNIPLKDQMIDSMLGMAAEQRWGDIEFDDIINHAALNRDDVLEYFDDKADILIAYGRRLDRRMIENAALEALEDNHDIEDSVIRERIFDLIMERFDVLNENRDAVISILESLKLSPKDALITLPHLGKSIARILSEAGVDDEGITGCGKVLGLTGVYLYTVKTWMNDDTADMAKTMAVLDKYLGLAEETVNTLTDGNLFDILGNVKNIFRKDA